MTLLEAVTALVIVGLSVAGWIGLAQGTTRTTRDAVVWERVVMAGESAMEAALLGAEPAPPADGIRTTVAVRPYAPGVSDVVVTASAPDGTRLVLHRLVHDGSP